MGLIRNEATPKPPSQPELEQMGIYPFLDMSDLLASTPSMLGKKGIDERWLGFFTGGRPACNFD